MGICNGVPSNAAPVTFWLAPQAALQSHILDLYHSISHGPSLICNRNSDHNKHYLLGILISEPVNIIMTTYRSCIRIGAIIWRDFNSLPPALFFQGSHRNSSKIPEFFHDFP